MARCLIIGCGCRGRALSAALVEGGHVVRGTTRDPQRASQIAAAGAEPLVADPDRVGTLVGALAGVSVVVILLGSAAGSRGQLEAIHGSRLEMLLTKLVDTTVRGVVYETAGEVDGAILARGADRVLAYGERNLATCELLDADPGSREAWVQAAVSAVERVLAAR